MSLHKFKRRRKDGKSFSLRAFQEETGCVVWGLTLRPVRSRLGSASCHTTRLFCLDYTQCSDLHSLCAQECVLVKELWSTVERTLAIRSRLQAKYCLTLFQSEFSLNIASRVNLPSLFLYVWIFLSLYLVIWIALSLFRSLLLVIYVYMSIYMLYRETLNESYITHI